MNGKMERSEYINYEVGEVFGDCLILQHLKT